MDNRASDDNRANKIVERDLSSHPLNRFNDFQLLLFVVVIALVMRMVFFTGLFAVDDFNYLRHAAQFWKGCYDLGKISYWHGTRFLVFVPVSFSFALFGVSEITAVLWSLVASLCVLVLIFKIGKILHSREAGFYAALLGSALPVMVNESTWVTPGPVAELVIGVSVLLFLKGENSRFRRGWLLFFSGVAFALIAFAGNIGLVSAAFFVLSYLFYKRGDLAGYGRFFLGLALVIASGAMLYWVETGNPLTLVKISGNIFSSEVQQFNPFFYLRRLTSPIYSQGGIIYLICLALVTYIFSRKRSLLLVCLWFIAEWAFIEFGSSSVMTYRPLFKQVRYMSVLVLPAVLSAGIGIAELRNIVLGWRGYVVKSYISQVAVIMIFVLFFASSLLFLYRGGAYKRAQRSFIQTVAENVRKYRGEVVYVTHWLWNSRVAYFMGYQDDYFTSGYHPDHALDMDTADPDSRNLYVQLLESGDQLKPGILIFDEALFELSNRDERVSGMIGPGEIPYYVKEFAWSGELIADIDMEGDRRLKVFEIQGGRWNIPGPK
jgi:4-amino-4-deoxy-L-arabinose transferase-like glycosyltransferase